MEPLILTLAMDASSQEHFDALRAAHFPAERNYLDAHITLFHHLLAEPGEAEDTLREVLAREAARTPAYTLVADRLMRMGRGVAYRLDSKPALALRRRLVRVLGKTLDDPLTPQDRQPFTPHITVQNKVSPERALATLEELSADSAPRQITATGLTLWRYLDGPWEFVDHFEFVEPLEDSFEE